MQKISKISYFVSECSEFHNLGLYEEHLSLDEAWKIYTQIDPNRLHGVPSLGCEIEGKHLLDDTCDLIRGGQSCRSEIEKYHFQLRGNPMVLESLNELEKRLKGHEKEMEKKNLKRGLRPVVINKNRVEEGGILRDVEGTDLTVKVMIMEDDGPRDLTEDEIKSLCMTKEEMFRLALRNQQQEGYALIPLSQITGQYDPSNTLVLTRHGGQYGASEILNKEAMADAAEQIGSYYIIPSSRHELQLVPKETGLTAEDLNFILETMNERIPVDDRLSNQVYEYSFARKKISIPEKVNEEQGNVSEEQETTSTHMGRR